MNETDTINHVYVSVCSKILLWDKCPQVQFLGYMTGAYSFSVTVTDKTFPEWLSHLHSAQRWQRTTFLPISPVSHCIDPWRYLIVFLMSIFLVTTSVEYVLFIWYILFTEISAHLPLFYTWFMRQVWELCAHSTWMVFPVLELTIVSCQHALWESVS